MGQRRKFVVGQIDGRTAGHWRQWRGGTVANRERFGFAGDAFMTMGWPAEPGGGMAAETVGGVAAVADWCTRRSTVSV